MFVSPVFAQEKEQDIQIETGVKVGIVDPHLANCFMGERSISRSHHSSAELIKNGLEGSSRVASIRNKPRASDFWLDFCFTLIDRSCHNWVTLHSVDCLFFNVIINRKGE
ncbi:MAG: hypothetical protein CBB96_03810 [Gammaproteobacteria bacterium TMED36]|nr:MAG: hypothetical protein CBB96_03810 [Gammaproteobacteria bacterium TMED36]